MIRQLTAKAFKGLRDFTIEPQNVNLLIGANGTGKTNFADLILFLSLICQRGLNGAFEELGGVGTVRMRQPRRGRQFRFHIRLVLDEDSSRGIGRVTYEFFLGQGSELRVDEEHLEATVYKRKPGKPARQGVPRFDLNQPITLSFHRTDGRIVVSDALNTISDEAAQFDDPQELLLAAFSRLGEVRTISDYLNSWRVYNIDAVISKRSTGGSDTELDRLGANTVPFVAGILKDPVLRRRLLDDLREVVPYIESIEPDRVLTYQTLRFRESDRLGTGAEFQLPEMSDGTIRLLGLLATLRQPIPPAVLVIEEPENALHSHAIQYFLRVVRQVATNPEFASQVFLTSHSPVVVDEVLSLEAQDETQKRTAGFVTQRKLGAPSIVSIPSAAMHGITQNLGRPSDFLREGSFGDEPFSPTQEQMNGA
jgi:predicted ATPase